MNLPFLKRQEDRWTPASRHPVALWRRARITVANRLDLPRDRALGAYWSIPEYRRNDADGPSSTSTEVLPACRVAVAGSRWSLGTTPGFKDRVIDHPPVFVHRFQGGRVWGHRSGVLMTRSRVIIREFSHEPFDVFLHPALYAAMPGCTAKVGRAAFLGTPEASDNYGHWLLDLLPRISLLRRAGVDLEKLDAIVLNHAGSRWQLETLQALGVPSGRVINLSDKSMVDADEWIVPTCIRNTLDPHPALLGLVGSIDERAPAENPGTRLFLGRRDASFRRLLEEDQLHALLAKAGYVRFEPSRHSVAEQAWVFGRATSVVGVHGSAFANVVFMKEGTHIAEAHSDAWPDGSFWRVAAARGISHGMVSGTALEPWRRARFRDFSITARSLEDFVDRVVEAAR